MHGTPLSVMAEISIPDAPHFLRFAAPFLAVVAFLFLWNRMGAIIGFLFPNLEWEKKLGWLNITAQHRADAFMRWLGYFVYAILALALLGILWVAEGFSVIDLDQWTEPQVMVELIVRMLVLLVSLGFWLYYLSFELIPKMHGQYEEEELEKFRIEQKVLDQQKSTNPGSPLSSSTSRFGVHRTTAANAPGPGFDL
jgi:hypothetical protein